VSKISGLPFNLNGPVSAITRKKLTDTYTEQHMTVNPHSPSETKLKPHMQSNTQSLLYKMKHTKEATGFNTGLQSLSHVCGSVAILTITLKYSHCRQYI